MIKRIRYIGVFLVLLSLIGCSFPSAAGSPPDKPISGSITELPIPLQDSDTSIEEALLGRRSVRTYSGEPLTLEDISQLLWAAQGITSPSGYRTAPSAGGLYPLELYLLVGDVDGLSQGVYQYIPQEHALSKTVEGDKRDELQGAALDQSPVGDGFAVIVITAIYERTTGKYGQRGDRYVHMEVGSAAQNIYLQAGSLGLGTVFIGAFDDDVVKEILALEASEQPLGLMPVGKR